LKDVEKKILDDLEPVLQSMGIELVEVNAAVVKKIFNIRLVIFREEGIALKDCEGVHKVVQPRFELLLESRDIALEITSPGIDRKIKGNREYRIFKGKSIRVLLEDESEWISGRISEADAETLTLSAQDGDRRIQLNTIRKAKLDHTMEAR